MSNIRRYPPGSQHAQQHGCECPVMDNRYGRGMYNDANGVPQYVMSERCTLHWEEAIQEAAEHEHD